jgi:gluconate 5-dehydrogenase
MSKQHDLFDLKGKVALVIGAAGGIGAAIAEALAEHGAEILAIDRDLDNTIKLVENLGKNGYQATAYPLDISDIGAINQMVAFAKKTFKRIDILVNSAGINIRKAVIDITEEDWDPVININLKSIMFCCQAVAKEMIHQQSGKIINIASISSLLGHPDRCAYASSKGGLIQMTKVMATEWAPYNICVNAISPAAVDTPFITKLKSNQKRLNREKERIPLGRIATPEDMMAPAVFLASKGSDFITGHNLIVDGGRTVD